MKKNILLTLLILIMVVGLAACKKEPEPVEPVPPAPDVEEPVEEANEDEKEVIMEAFNTLIEGEKKPEELISYINDNIKKLSSLEGDRMIDELEKTLENNIEDLTNLIFATDKGDELMAIAGTETFFPENKVEEIKDEDLKKEIQKTFDNMYKLINLEGEFYPIIDYAKLKTYEDKLSDEWKSYLDIMAMDSEKRPFADGGMTITFEELAERILETERHLNTYIDGPRQKELLSLYESKLTAYMKGLPNTPIADYSNKQIFDQVLESYEKTSNNEGYITAHTLYQYVEVIKSNKSIVNNSVLKKADELITEAVRMLTEYK
ncbi:hypothetical protein [Tissierella sp. Yu-01]|uniref:hypothetical protein n=1 Tax=Tissierella sp. Yu-01 TaxID=3035694 RepID=UPI00240E4EAC|nr:hypothetical protein [Tissierella sp. Yu-01]WFA08122.1 hypothetical protein P3962_10315 [Tissierella sp. Yu-01]